MKRKTLMLITGAAVVAVGGATVAMTLTSYDLSWYTMADAGGVTFAEGGDTDVYTLGATVGQVDANVPYEMVGGDYTLNAGFWPGATQVLFCEGDVDADGDTDFQDLLIVLAFWGPCPAPPTKCAADIDGPAGVPDGEVGFFDLLIVLSYWGCGVDIEVEGGTTGGPAPVPPLEEILARADVDMTVWNQFLEVVEVGPWDQQDLWLCWMKRHLATVDETAEYYLGNDARDCPGPDPVVSPFDQQ